MKYCFIVLFFLYSSSTFGYSFEGEWVASDIIYRGKSWSISEEEAKLYIGQKVELLKSSASSESVICNNPKYIRDTLNTDEFYSSYRISLANIGVFDDIVNVWEVSCTKSWYKFGYSFLYTFDEQLFVIYDGYIFKMKRT